MGKFVYAVLMVFMIEFALWLFEGTSYSTTSLFTILFDPSTLGSNPLYLAIIAAVATFGVASIIPGNIYQNYISLFYVGLVSMFITFTWSIVHFWSFINLSLSGVTSEPMARIISIMIASPLIALYIISTVEWIRSNQ